MNVLPGAQRKLVGATLLKEVFERSPYGCKLFCCWCRQDLDACYFWESMGFIPLAFRTGANVKSTHIFWQRRVREGDATTPLWFPAKTEGGMMRADRLVLPIPPGVCWRDAMPVLIPELQRVQSDSGLGSLPEDLRSAHPSGAVLSQKSGSSRKRSGETPKPHNKPYDKHIMHKTQVQPVQQQSSTMGRLWFAPSGSTKLTAGKPEKKKREKVKADPAHVAKARELRDRYLEQFNAGMLTDGGHILPVAKYAVAKQINAPPAPSLAPALPLLEAA
jgi:hypothetical protein